MMKNLRLLTILLSALPLAAAAQTKPATTSKPGTVTEVTEELDPATGKVIKRTTRTTTVPAGTPLPSAAPNSTSSTTTTTSSDGGIASDSEVSDFFREKIAVGALTAPELLATYGRFIDKVRADRQGWSASSWNQAAAVMSSLNNRYEQLRASFSLDDKLSIRSQQAEFQALRTARQISRQVSDKL